MQRFQPHTCDGPRPNKNLPLSQSWSLLQEVRSRDEQLCAQHRRGVSKRLKGPCSSYQTVTMHEQEDLGKLLPAVLYSEQARLALGCKLRALDLLSPIDIAYKKVPKFLRLKSKIMSLSPFNIPSKEQGFSAGAGSPSAMQLELLPPCTNTPLREHSCALLQMISKQFSTSEQACPTNGASGVLFNHLLQLAMLGDPLQPPVNSNHVILPPSLDELVLETQ